MKILLKCVTVDVISRFFDSNIATEFIEIFKFESSEMGFVF